MVELLPGVPPALLHNAQLDHRKVRYTPASIHNLVTIQRENNRKQNVVETSV
jgi:hypothetical protein